MSLSNIFLKIRFTENIRLSASKNKDLNLGLRIRPNFLIEYRNVNVKLY